MIASMTLAELTPTNASSGDKDYDELKGRMRNQPGRFGTL